MAGTHHAVLAHLCHLLLCPAFPRITLNCPLPHLTAQAHAALKQLAEAQAKARAPRPTTAPLASRLTLQPRAIAAPLASRPSAQFMAPTRPTLKSKVVAPIEVDPR